MNHFRSKKIMVFRGHPLAKKGDFFVYEVGPRSPRSRHPCERRIHGEHGASCAGCLAHSLSGRLPRAASRGGHHSSSAPGAQPLERRPRAHGLVHPSGCHRCAPRPRAPGDTAWVPPPPCATRKKMHIHAAAPQSLASPELPRPDKTTQLLKFFGSCWRDKTHLHPSVRAREGQKLLEQGLAGVSRTGSALVCDIV